ncbi:diacylglycerol kinase [Luteitalea sp. TBR-22]|uniref:cytochrome c n=1 Tax=Luteitalea sp. TBR-22 TaxID=2802971 RepID=UPI001AF1E491|nr:c-type cytochrome [Luteitalea sp. TBR-22]BCS32107.1 diacylglycerol kinase [Luteitalea sp. TBR-22]
MTPLRHWLTRTAAAGAVLAGLAWGSTYLLTERRLHATSAWPVLPVGRVPADEAARRDGARLGRVLGCASCHGEGLSGARHEDARTGVDLVAPNLTRLVPAYGDDALARAIRAGVGRDGRALYGMPARSFRHLTDEDVRRLIAWLRTLPARADAVGARRLRLIDRLRLLAGVGMPDALTMAPAAPIRPSASDATTRGRYLAHVACGECHGATLEGDGARVPPLTVAVAYTEDAFRHLMRTGETPGGRDLWLMDDTARARFAHLTDEEIADLYAYLRSRAGQ